LVTGIIQINVENPPMITVWHNHSSPKIVDITFLIPARPGLN
jgi:hypothetical protein